MTILITGASGFSGKCLAKSIQGNKILLSRKKNLSLGSNDNIVICDLLNIEAIKKIIQDQKPTEIYHLAGSFTNQYEIDFNINVTATKNLLDAVKEHSKATRVLLIGSAAEYGLISKEMCPIKEDRALQPCNAYGLTKIYQKYLMDYYVNTYSLNLVMARPFNLYGKGISSRLFIGKIYKEINDLKKGYSNEISLGNLNSERDYISIEEAIIHYIKIMECGAKGEIYNVGLGIPTKTRDILKTILDKENIDISVIKENTRNIQANDSDRIYADISKLKGLYND